MVDSVHKVVGYVKGLELLEILYTRTPQTGVERSILSTYEGRDAIRQPIARESRHLKNDKYMLNDIGQYVWWILMGSFRKVIFGKARWTFMLAVLLLVSIPVHGGGKDFDMDLVEVGRSLEPSGTSIDMAIDSNMEGTFYLLTGYGHADEIRVLNKGLGTRAVIELPEDDFSIKGSAISTHIARVLVWGRSAGNTNDTLFVYDLDEGAYDADLIPNGTVPLVTIDQARLYASELILMITGRDSNGTSKVLFIETAPNEIHAEEDVTGNRSVLHIDTDGHIIAVLDEDGGVQIFETNSWTLTEQHQILDSETTVHEMHAERFWTLATSDGYFVVGWPYGDGWTVEGNVDLAPVEGAYYYKRIDDSIFAVTACPSADGGSTIEFWAGGELGIWELMDDTKMEKTVSFIHHVPGEDDNLLIGYDDGSIVQYRLVINEAPEDERGSIYLEGHILIPLIIVVAVVLLLWWRKGKSGSVDGESS